MNRSHAVVLYVCWGLAPFIAMAGCGNPYEIAEVDGVLLIDGEPGHKVFVQFIPDVDAGTRGPISTAETDDEGRFALTISESGEGTQSGAVVGMHRVALSDMQLAESATGEGIPIRLSSEYALPGSTPLSQEVTAGKQTIELKVSRPDAGGS